MIPQQRPAGFTLLEVLTALAVLGLILMLLNQAMRTGWRALDIWHNGTQAQADFEPVEQALRHLIERMDPGLFPEPPLVRGTATSFVFTTELPDSGTGGRIAADTRLGWEDGSLVLWWTPHGRGVPFLSPSPPQRLVLLEQVSGLELAYRARGPGRAWQNRWAEETLPGLVRLQIPARPPIVARPGRERAEE